MAVFLSRVKKRKRNYISLHSFPVNRKKREVWGKVWGQRNLPKDCAAVLFTNPLHTCSQLKSSKIPLLISNDHIIMSACSFLPQAVKMPPGHEWTLHDTWEILHFLQASKPSSMAAAASKREPMVMTLIAEEPNNLPVQSAHCSQMKANTRQMQMYGSQQMCELVIMEHVYECK